MISVGLRTRLEGLKLERRAYEELLRKNRIETGEALVEVRESEPRSLSEAADLLGLSRPTVYSLLADAEASAA